MDITLNGRTILAEDAEPGLIEAATNVLGFLVDESQTADLSTADCWSILFDNNHDNRADSFEDFQTHFEERYGTSPEINQNQYHLLASRVDEIRSEIISEGNARVVENEQDARTAIGIAGAAIIVASGFLALAAEAATTTCVITETVAGPALRYTPEMMPQVLRTATSLAGGGGGMASAASSAGPLSSIPGLANTAGTLARTVALSAEGLELAVEGGSAIAETATTATAISGISAVSTGATYSTSALSFSHIIGTLIPFGIAGTVIDQLGILDRSDPNLPGEQAEYRALRDQELSFGLSRSIADGDSSEGINPTYPTMSIPVTR
jgi:hypothetical protein